MSSRAIGIAVLAVVVALGGAWMWGASGKSDVDRQRRVAEQRAEYETARASMLEGRVSLFMNNFGDASKHFENARIALERLQTQLREVSQAERAGRVEIVLSNVKDAQRLSGQLDASAQNAAAAALQALAGVGLSQ